MLNGLRAAVGAGFVDGAEEGMKEGGLPRWIGEVAGEGRNLLRVGEGGRE